MHVASKAKIRIQIILLICIGFLACFFIHVVSEIVASAFIRISILIQIVLVTLWGWISKVLFSKHTSFKVLLLLINWLSQCKLVYFLGLSEFCTIRMLEIKLGLYNIILERKGVNSWGNCCGRSKIWWKAVFKLRFFTAEIDFTKFSLEKLLIKLNSFICISLIISMFYCLVIAWIVIIFFEPSIFAQWITRWSLNIMNTF